MRISKPDGRGPQFAHATTEGAATTSEAAFLELTSRPRGRESGRDQSFGK